MSYADASYVQLGYLRDSGHGLYVVCLECSNTKPHTTMNLAPIFDVNLRPYRQPCALCGRELINAHAGVILFDGKVSK